MVHCTNIPTSIVISEATANKEETELLQVPVHWHCTPSPKCPQYKPRKWTKHHIHESQLRLNGQLQPRSFLLVTHHNVIPFQVGSSKQFKESTKNKLNSDWSVKNVRFQFLKIPPTTYKWWTFKDDFVLFHVSTQSECLQPSYKPLKITLNCNCT